MADYYTFVVMQPALPADRLDHADLALLEEFGFSLAAVNGGLYAHNTSGEFYTSELAREQVAETSLAAAGLLAELVPDPAGMLQLEDFLVYLCNKAGLPWLSLETAYTCSEHRPDGFGGSAIFATPSGCTFLSTGEWIKAQIDRLTTPETAAAAE